MLSNWHAKQLARWATARWASKGVGKRNAPSRTLSKTRCQNTCRCPERPPSPRPPYSPPPSSDTAGHTFSGCCLSSSSFADLPASTDTLAITNCTGELQLPPLLLATLISLEITSSPIAPEVLSHPNFLRALNLTNALPALPPTLLSSFPNLLSLNLSHNPLTTPPSFPPSFTNTLRDLNLENCRLTTIANALTELTQLKILNVACNDMPVEELTVMSTLTWPSKLESLTLLPMPSLSASPTFPRALTLLLKKSICLKTLNCAPFEQTMTVDVQKLASMDLHAGDDDPNVKDSATCR